MKKLLILTIILAASMAGQNRLNNLTPAQKETDFRYLASLFATYYAPLEWKKELFKVDGLDIKTWLDRVAKTQSDLEFYDLMIDYVAAFQDTHVSLSLPSDFLAVLNIGADVYDGKVLIESINRTRLPVATFPFVIGDELVSIDGVPLEELLTRFSKYGQQGNPISTRRVAAALIVIRPQSVIPFAAEVGESASVVIRRQNGNEETYTLPWTKTGTPMEVGPVPGLRTTSSAAKERTAARGDYMAELEKLRHSGVSGPAVEFGVLNYGARNPVFVNGLGPTFTRRLGGSAADFFYSGTFAHDGLRIGFIRIPSYQPPSQAVALAQFEQEIAFFEANTDGLIVDGMRNPGGNLCFGENIVARLTPQEFRTTGFELRAFWLRVVGYYNLMLNAKATNAPPDVIEQYEKLYEAMLAAYRTNRGVTEPIPICTSSLQRAPARNASGANIAYTKPLMMLIDEFSTSTADSVPAMIQENGRGVLYGNRTNGAGGNNTSFPGGPYSETFVGITIGIQDRFTPVQRADYPVTRKLENVGVYPDVVDDYMTRENLIQGGAPFVRNFLEAMSAYIRQR